MQPTLQQNKEVAHHILMGFGGCHCEVKLFRLFLIFSIIDSPAILKGKNVVHYCATKRPSGNSALRVFCVPISWSMLYQSTIFAHGDKKKSESKIKAASPLRYMPNSSETIAGLLIRTIRCFPLTLACEV